MWENLLIKKEKAICFEQIAFFFKCVCYSQVLELRGYVFEYSVTILQSTY